MREKMKGKFLRLVIASIGCFLALTVGILAFMEKRTEAGEKGRGLVILNEIDQLTTHKDGSNPAKEEIAQLGRLLKEESGEGRKTMKREVTLIVMAAALLCMIAVFGVIYGRILAPFYKLEKYADELAKGNMDFPLQVERNNFFGAFTWAFDHMRKEITEAREREKSAISENKTIIATLSHDIKTPVASIRAYAEGLEASLEADYEQRERYLQVIIKKCDEVTRLTNDLVVHSLSELDRLSIVRERIEIRKLVTDTLRDLEYACVTICQPLPEAWVWGDEKRIAQVLSNLIDNARKYAPGAKVEVSAAIRENRYEISVRDYGKGVPPEDMPFILNKFYRGKNVEDKPGSGLGLYIVSYIMEKMEGGVALYNHEDGLEVSIWLKESSLHTSAC